ncbi:MAG: hypothetical protein ACI91R_002672, partial [Vicingaceae bacterium]
KLFKRVIFDVFLDFRIVKNSFFSIFYKRKNTFELE